MAELSTLGSVIKTAYEAEPPTAASDTGKGIVELATIAEVDTGTDTERAITPAGLAGSALAASAANGDKVEFVVACSDETTSITADTSKVSFRMPYAMTLTDIKADVNTAPTGANIIVDVNESGSTIMTTNKITIEATETTSEDATTPPGITDSALADNAVITIDFDQVGSTEGGKGLKVTFIGTRA